MKKLIIAVAVIPLAAFAAEGDPIGFLDQIMEFVKSLGEGSMIMIIAGVVEFVFRMIKTPEPLSIAWLISKALKKIGELCGMVAALMDKVLPQRIS